MDAVDRALSTAVTFIGLLFGFAIAWALSETLYHLHFSIFGSRVGVLYAMMVAAAVCAALRWRQLARRASPVKAAARDLVEFGSSDREIDMAEADDVVWVRAHRDPALWHEAAMAALAYRGDPYGFLPWVLQQPETDRATAGWIFFWAEGSRYLGGETDFYLNNLDTNQLVELFKTICERSEGVGFARDSLGLDRDFDAERQRCLAVVKSGDVAPGVIAPITMLVRPFNPPRQDDRFFLDDGIIFVRGLNQAEM